MSSSNKTTSIPQGKELTSKISIPRHCPLRGNSVYVKRNLQKIYYFIVPKNTKYRHESNVMSKQLQRKNSETPSTLNRLDKVFTK